MNRLRKFLELPPHLRSLALRAVLIVVLIRVGLWAIPFRSLFRLVSRFNRIAPGKTASATLPAERIAWVIAGVARLVPQATCLTQALAGQILLAAAGHPSVLVIGVRKGGKDGLCSHAVLESGGKMVLGGPAAGFAPLAVMSNEQKSGGGAIRNTIGA